MSDLISRQKAIEALKEYEVVESDNFTRTDPVSMMAVATIANCIEAIVELPSAEPERKWIPVSEALPDEYIDVLLQFPHTMAVGYQEDGFWNIITCDDLYSGLDEKDEKPIAWMPLPEPWRSE